MRMKRLRKDLDSYQGMPLKAYPKSLKWVRLSRWGSMFLLGTAFSAASEGVAWWFQSIAKADAQYDG